MVVTLGPAMSNEETAHYVAQRAPQLGLDPAAVMAVGEQEGMSRQPGDDNTSFGIWQLHAGGALPAEIWAQGPQFAQSWALSQAGVDYALVSMGQVANGLQGPAAIIALVTNFERPRADLVAGEIAKAIGAFAKWAAWFTQQIPIPGFPNPPIPAPPQGEPEPVPTPIPNPQPLPEPITPGPSPTTPAQPKGSLGGALQTLIAGTLGPNLAQTGTKPDLSGLILLLASLFAILIGAIIWRGNDVKKYAPRAAGAYMTG